MGRYIFRHLQVAYPGNDDSREGWYLSVDFDRVIEDEYEILVGPVARSGVLEALEGHGGLAVPDAGVPVDDLPSGYVVPCLKGDIETSQSMSESHNIHM